MSSNTRPTKSRVTEPPAPPKYNPNLPLAEQVLGNAQASREVVQDFCPLAQSLEWELGQEYLRERGNKAFISDASPVPFVINNDGTLSRHAAEVFFANLVEADKAGNPPSPRPAPIRAEAEAANSPAAPSQSSAPGGQGEADIFVLELGIGVGLFARYFLDHFRALCRQHRKDYYSRLCYIAADRSPRMLMDVLRHGVLSGHPGRWRVRLIDAMEPEKYLRGDVMFGVGARNGKPLRAVFLNYLLDCLPAAVLEVGPSSSPSPSAAPSAEKGEGTTEVKQLCVRTLVARHVDLAERTDMTVAMLRERAESKDQELLEVYGLFASEYDYRPVDVSTLPHGAFAVDYAQRVSRKLICDAGDDFVGGLTLGQATLSTKHALKGDIPHFFWHPFLFIST